MGLKRLVGPTELIPRGYGVAYCKFNSMQAVCYPVPLNFVAGWLHWTWWTLRGWHSMSDVERWVKMARHDGRQRGLQDGYAMGRRDALNDTKRCADKVRACLADELIGMLDAERAARNAKEN